MCKRLSIWLGWRRNRNVINRDITGGQLLVSIQCTLVGIYCLWWFLLYWLVSSGSAKETWDKWMLWGTFKTLALQMEGLCLRLFLPFVTASDSRLTFLSRCVVNRKETLLLALMVSFLIFFLISLFYGFLTRVPLNRLVGTVCQYVT